MVTQRKLSTFTSTSEEYASRSIPPWALREVWKFAMKEMGTPDVPVDTKLNKTVWAQGIRNVSDYI
ncbi:rCG52905 [Rattus norvegicus]|uniref:RCG52905 n=1 Tax=Rattus norvegicus TaxID=10116 RepID=A6IRW5_RAT|nr:rCG52905 [Rattus norvegicus]